jgi:virginiamycin B lyase
MPTPNCKAPTGVAFDARGDIWFGDPGANSLGEIGAAGGIQWFGFSHRPPTLPGPVITGPDGNVWFTDLRFSHVDRVNPDGTITPIGSGFYPGAMTTGPANDIWFATFASISRLHNDQGWTQSQVLIPGALATPAGITEGPDGGVWFAENNRALNPTAPDAIGRIARTGAVAAFNPTKAATPSTLAASVS